MANTPTRYGTNQIQLRNLIEILSGLNMTADQCSEIIRSIARCLADDEYKNFGSVDLSDIAQTMDDEIAAFCEPSLCTACNGSGEGMHDGTTCGTCKGKGETPSQREIEQLQGE